MDDRTELIVRLWNECRRYFRACVTQEPLLGYHDVDDLAADVMVAVIPRLDGLSQPDHYVRRVARNQLLRVLKHRRRTCNLDDGLYPAEELWASQEEDGRLSDGDSLVLAIAQAVLLEEDDATRKMVTHRCASPARTFKEISQMTGVASSALRMRMSRYTARVRSALPHSTAFKNPVGRVVVHRTKTR